MPRHARYREAIDAFHDTLRWRATTFRHQIVAVTLIVLATVVLWLTLQSQAVLVSVLLLVPLCGVFVVVDARRVSRWRTELLTAWAQREIDLAAFVAAIRAHRTLPEGTVDAMLATLPSTGDLAAEQAMESPARRALAAVVIAGQRDRENALVLRVVASGIAVMALLASIWATCGAISGTNG